MNRSHFQFAEDLEFIFRARLFRGSKEFASTVWNDLTPGETIPQSVEGGDASPEVASDQVVVVVDEIGALLERPTVRPNPFTPNGDGINEEVMFSFDLFLLLDKIEVTLDIHDLSGRPVYRSVPTTHTAGSVQVAWDGRDNDGNLVAPGIYLYRLRASSDEEASQQAGIVALVH